MVLDIINLIQSIASGAFNFNANVSGVSEATGNTVVVIALILILAIGSIGTMIKLYLAVKGMRQAYGKSKGYGNLTWAKIVLVLLVIGIIGTIVNVAHGTDYWYRLISPIVSLIAAFFYIKAGTALKG